MLVRERQVSFVEDDVDEAFLAEAKMAGRVAWDIETSGLSWESDAIGTCQIAVGGAVVIVKVGNKPPANLRELLGDAAVTKVFHHAPFDLRFMVKQWGAEPQSIACTKIASKILDPDLEGPEHSLKPVLARELGVEVSKALQVSDWTARTLSMAQLEYAATDVVFLEALLDQQLQRAYHAGLTALLEASFRYLPTRAHLDIRGPGDVFAY